MIRVAVVCAALVLAAPAAHAHVSATEGFVQAVLHPLSGLDHLLAIVAVAWWGVVRKSAASAITLFVGAVGAGLLVPSLLSPNWLEALAACSLLCFGGLLVVRNAKSPVFAYSAFAVFGAVHGAIHGATPPEHLSLATFVTGILVGTALTAAMAWYPIKRFATEIRHSAQAAGGLIGAVGVVILLMA